MWMEMRTAMMVARLGSVRAAAAELGVHRATVTRHIDALEASLGCKLFLRHSEGYALTSEGHVLKNLAETTDGLVTAFERDLRTRKSRLSGPLKIASLARAGELIVPAVASFQRANPDVKIKYVVENALTRLELGQADIAVRVGQSPEHPDYVVMPLDRIELGLYGSRAYVARRGAPATPGELRDHDLVAIEDARGTVDLVAAYGVPEDNIVYTANDPTLSLLAVQNGMGLGILAKIDVKKSELVEVLPDFPHPTAHVWLLTHVDIHRTPIVQAFLQHVRAARQGPKS